MDSSNKPPIFSREQLDWVASQTHKAAHNAARRTRNQALIGFLILFAGLLVVGYEDRRHDNSAREQIVRSGDVVAVEGCNRDYVTIDALRDGLEDSLDRIRSLEADGTYSQRQAELAREQTIDFLDRYKLPDCRIAEQILSDNPNATLREPVPRYPTDEAQRDSEAAEEDGGEF